MSLTDHPAYRLVSDHARALGARIAQETADGLDQMHEPLLSGEDSGLTTVWQEICAQVQGEESFFWGAYEQVMHDAVLGHLQQLSETEQEMLWLRTEPGWDWLWDVVNCGDEPAPADPGVDHDDIARWIVAEFLRGLAESFEDPDVDRYLAGGSAEEELDEGADEDVDDDDWSDDDADESKNA